LKVKLLETGAPVECITYQVTKEFLEAEDEDARPSAVYKDVILKGAKEHNLPQEYIKK